MKKIIILLLLLPVFATAQEVNNKRASLFLGTSQGMSFVLRGANLAHDDNPFSPKPGYSYKYSVGLNLLSKSGKSFSDFTLSYRSDGSVLNNIIDTRPIKEGIIKANDRFNFVSLGYSYGRYLNQLWGNKTFVKGGIELSYVLNRKTTTKYSDGTPKYKEKVKGNQLAWNNVISTSPTFLLSYGMELDKPVFGFGNKSQISMDFTYDYFFAGMMPSAAHNNFGIYLSYKVLF